MPGRFGNVPQNMPDSPVAIFKKRRVGMTIKLKYDAFFSVHIINKEFGLKVTTPLKKGILRGIFSIIGTSVILFG